MMARYERPAGPLHPGWLSMSWRSADRESDLEGSPDFRTKEGWRGNTDDGDRNAIDRNRLPDRIGGTTKPALPEAIADHRDAGFGRAQDILSRRERTPGKHRHAEFLKERCAHVQPFSWLAIAAPGEIEP
jgi:hypothetical protein